MKNLRTFLLAAILFFAATLAVLLWTGRERLCTEAAAA